MYKIQVARVKLSNLFSKFKFININQMSIHLFPVMHFRALRLVKKKVYSIFTHYFIKGRDLERERYGMKKCILCTWVRAS
jgi:hypothetical protein